MAGPGALTAAWEGVAVAGPRTAIRLGVVYGQAELTEHDSHAARAARRCPRPAPTPPFMAVVDVRRYHRGTRADDRRRTRYAPVCGDSTIVCSSREGLHHRVAADPADPAVGAGPAAEGQVRLPVVGGLVDVDPAGPDPVGELQAARQVGGVDRRQQAVGAVVGQRDGVLERGDLHHGGDGPEGLLGGHARVGGHAGEHGGLPVEVGGEGAGAGAAGQRLGAALHRVGDVLVHLGRHRLVVERAHRRLVGERVAEDDLLGDRAGQLLHVLVVDRAVHEDALAGRAALAGAQEAGHQRRLDGGVDVAVVEQHEWAVAAHLQQRRLARRGRGHRGARWRWSR